MTDDAFSARISVTVLTRDAALHRLSPTAATVYGLVVKLSFDQLDTQFNRDQLSPVTPDEIRDGVHDYEVDHMATLPLTPISEGDIDAGLAELCRYGLVEHPYPTHDDYNYHLLTLPEEDFVVRRILLTDH